MLRLIPDSLTTALPVFTTDDSIQGFFTGTYPPSGDGASSSSRTLSWTPSVGLDQGNVKCGSWLRDRQDDTERVAQSLVGRRVARIYLTDEVEWMHQARQFTQQRVKRLGKDWVDGLYPGKVYRREKRALEENFTHLVVPGIDAAKEAGILRKTLPTLWAEATLRNGGRS